MRDHRHPLILALVLWGMACPVAAGQLQYHIATGYITGVRDEPPIPTVSGYEVVTIPESVDAIQWPVPSGCLAGEGRPEWTKIDTPASVTVSGGGMSVRPDLALFGTTSTLFPGCHLAGSRRELVAAIEARLLAKIQDFDFAVILSHLNALAFSRCGASGGGANCDTTRANLDTLDALLPSAAQLASFTNQLVSLRTETAAFISGQCQANPGGAFCP